MRTTDRFRASGVAAFGLAVLLAAAGAGGAQAKEKKDADASLRWRRTYREALLEARLRNVPVLVTRQKDG